jgi:Leucine-rich repeat (LRR) protein/GTPase SAR1 family protein
MPKNKATRSAEHKIQEALQVGAVELDLSAEPGAPDHERLSELPESLGELTQLRKLDLSENLLTTLPVWFSEMQLQELNLSNNKLTTLPDRLGELMHLRSLNLSENELTNYPDWLGHLIHLQNLELSDSRVKELPEWLGQLTDLRFLDVSWNGLTALPDSLGRLTRLTELNLSNNKLTALPNWFGQLEQLESLDLSGNELVTLPESFGLLAHLLNLRIGPNRLEVVPTVIQKLTQLKQLFIWGNQIDSLPSWLGALSKLETLGVPGNRITELPDSIGELSSLGVLHLGESPGGNPLRQFPACLRKLRGLVRLDVRSCGLEAVPQWLDELEKLQWLGLADNSLSDIPASIRTLQKLRQLVLKGNPLNPDLAAAYKEGIDAVKRYLLEIEKGAKSRYEAKLLILGDGNEGKTCVSRALRGLSFRKQNSTRGVDVEQWKFPHPDHEADREKEITLNIWDFEGQEISHQTHQFFLTSQSLYLLVFKCRDQFLMDRAEYWLDTIRARAPQAKVAIVITQCEERSPHVPLDRIKAHYGDMLAEEWFFPVGCKEGKNIEKLQAFLQRSAANLEFMGSPWPMSYERAEGQIKAKSRTAHIPRAKLEGIFAKARVSEDNYEGAAAAMSRLGVITQFPDCPDLRNFVVLKPPWLTKAISLVMDDAQLSDDKGEIALARMEGIWSKAKYRGMFATFHDCMKEFELCYDLEDQTQHCLVPLRFGYVAPPIPWSNGEGLKERRMEYKLNIRPPMGIMSRFIVKTHHMIANTPEYPKGIYWHNGVFLRTRSPSPSEALCEFVPDERTFRVRVRAAFPQNMCEQIHGYLQAVFSFFSGLTAERSYGCIKVDSETRAEAQCSGVYTEKRIYTAISKDRSMLDCEFEGHEVDPRLLVFGFPSFSEFVSEKLLTGIVRREMDRPPTWAAPYLDHIDSLLVWARDNSARLDQLLRGQASLSAEFKQEAELKLRQYLRSMDELLDDRDFTSAPGLISITTKDRSPWNPAAYLSKTYVLTPYCENEEKIHACDDGCVEFTRDRAWWQKSAPWIARGTKLLATGLQLAFAGMPMALGADAVKAVEDRVKLMEELTKHLELETAKATPKAFDEGDENDFVRNLHGKDQETALTRTALTRLMEESAPDNYRARRWGSLRRVRMSDNSYRWLCGVCAEQRR